MSEKQVGNAKIVWFQPCHKLPKQLQHTARRRQCKVIQASFLPYEEPNGVHTAEARVDQLQPTMSNKKKGYVRNLTQTGVPAYDDGGP